jgi:hypothetical protein
MNSFVFDYGPRAQILVLAFLFFDPPIPFISSAMLRPDPGFVRIKVSGTFPPLQAKYPLNIKYIFSTTYPLFHNVLEPHYNLVFCSTIASE